jgi:hypothetical protein
VAAFLITAPPPPRGYSGLTSRNFRQERKNPRQTRPEADRFYGGSWVVELYANARPLNHAPTNHCKKLPDHTVDNSYQKPFRFFEQCCWSQITPIFEKQGTSRANGQPKMPHHDIFISSNKNAQSLIHFNTTYK